LFWLLAGACLSAERGFAFAAALDAGSFGRLAFSLTFCGFGLEVLRDGADERFSAFARTALFAAVRVAESDLLAGVRFAALDFLAGVVFAASDLLAADRFAVTVLDFDAAAFLSLAISRAPRL
jgi:hypothetical protein